MVSQPLRAKELINHPEFPYVTWHLEPTKKGKVSVAEGRGGPFNIAYEIHGHGPRLLLLIPGMGMLKTAWQRQTYDFGHKNGHIYTVLIFDNRGSGESDKPVMRYSSSEMARDVIELLEHVGWSSTDTHHRRLNIVGLSLGGMIAQELALLRPSLINSLTFTSTAPYMFNTTTFFQNLYSRLILLVPKPIDSQIALAKQNLYTADYLNGPDRDQYVVQPFATAGDRFAASELRKRWYTKDAISFSGIVSQIIAAGWHHMSDERLREIVQQVGKKRILVIHGAKDRMISVPHGYRLLKGLDSGLTGEEEGVRRMILKDQGHAIPIEKQDEFKKLIEEQIEIGESIGN